MASKPPDAPWADQPHKLITSPSKYRDITSHFAIYAASEMTNVHNMIIRGLNSIILQAPHVASSDQESYKAQDVKDLSYYTAAWVKTVDWHHFTEETVMFPAIEENIGQKGILAGAVEQHHAFHTELINLRTYCEECQTHPDRYRWLDISQILDKLGPPLVEHLYQEIEIFLSLNRFDAIGLKKAWDKGEEHAKTNGGISSMYDVVPTVLGQSDRTYEGGSGFPPFPSWVPYVVKYWFTRNNGAWRFLPCDLWGRPQPLQMLRETGTMAS